MPFAFGPLLDDSLLLFLAKFAASRVGPVLMRRSHAPDFLIKRVGGKRILFATILGGILPALLGNQAVDDIFGREVDQILKGSHNKNKGATHSRS